MTFVSSSWSLSSEESSLNSSNAINIQRSKHRGLHYSSAHGLFPEVLFDLLEDMTESGYKGVVSWSDDGLAFKVHQREIFMEHILPNYFGLTKKYNSFARQLQLWGFAFYKTSSSPNYGTYFHPFFVRGKSALLLKMTRVKIKGKGKNKILQSARRQRDETLSVSTDSTTSSTRLIASSPTSTMITLKQPSQEQEGKAGAAALLPGPFPTTYEKRDKQEEETTCWAAGISFCSSPLCDDAAGGEQQRKRGSSYDNSKEMPEETIVAGPDLVSHIIIPEPRPIEDMLLDHNSRLRQSWFELELLFSPQHFSHETTAKRLPQDYTRDSKLNML